MTILGRGLTGLPLDTDSLIIGVDGQFEELQVGTLNQVLTVTASGVDWANPQLVGLANVVEDTTPQLGGVLDAQGFNITDLGAPTLATDATNKNYVDTSINALGTIYVNVSGDTMTGFLTLHAHPVNDFHAATKKYSDDKFIEITGDTMTGFLTLNQNPVNNFHAATKLYVDQEIAAAVGVQNLNDLDDVNTPSPAIGQVLTYNGSAWIAQASGSGVTTFLALNDTPGSYAGNAGRFVRVNTGMTALEFATVISATGNELENVSEDLDPALGGNLNASNFRITNLATPTNTQDAVNKAYVDNNFVEIAGDTMTGFLTLHAHPVNDFHAATKKYVNDEIESAVQGLTVKDAVHAATTVSRVANYTDADITNAGVNDTLTSTTNGRFFIDGLLPDGNENSVFDLTTGVRILIKDQVNQKTNGIYNLTNAGSGNEKTTISTVADVSSSLGGKHFVINAANNAAAYYVWFNTGSSLDPAVVGRTPISVSISPNATAATVATATALALDTHVSGHFRSAANGNLVTVYTSTAGVANDAADFNTGFTIAVATQGSVGTSWVLTRSTDADNSPSGELVPGSFVFVQYGDTNSSTGWVASSPSSGSSNSYIINSITGDNIAFTKFSSAGSFTAGNGINISGNIISAVGVPSKISVGPSGIDISSSYTGQSSINTIGTITTGVWQGTPIDNTRGGFGVSISSYGAKSLISRDGSEILIGLANQYLRSSGTVYAPAYIDAIRDPNQAGSVVANLQPNLAATDNLLTTDYTTLALGDPAGALTPKGYVDARVSAAITAATQNVWTTITTETGSINPTTSSTALTILGGPGLASSASGATVNVNISFAELALVSPDTADLIIISDASDSGNLKKCDLSALIGGGGVTTFTGLTDTPPTITANQFVRGNPGGTALIFAQAVIPGDNITLLTNNAGYLTSALQNVVEDVTPQLGGPLDINGFDIVSVSNNDIRILPHGTGNIVLDQLNWPTGVGTSGQALVTDGAGTLTFQTITGSIQNLWERINADSGFAVANNPTDVFTIIGGTDISTSIAGDTLTIDYVGSPGIQNVWERINADSGFVIANTPTDILTVAGGTHIATAISGDTLTINYDGPLWATFTAQTGTTTANSLTDTFTINGGTGISTSISGDTLTITNTAPVTTQISNLIEDTSPQLGGDLDLNNFKILFDDGEGFHDVNSNELLIFQINAAAANHFEIENVATGNNPIFRSTGSDLNVGMNFETKGTGIYRFSSGDPTIVSLNGQAAKRLDINAGQGSGELRLNGATNTAGNGGIIRIIGGTGSAGSNGGDIIIRGGAEGAGGTSGVIGIRGSADERIALFTTSGSTANNYIRFMNALNAAPKIDAFSTINTNADLALNAQGTGKVVISNLRYPNADGTVGQVIETNGFGSLAFTTRLANVVEDTTPQLGGNLDVQTFAITTSVLNGDILIEPNGTGDVVIGPVGGPGVISGVDGTLPNGNGQDLFISGGSGAGSGDGGNLVLNGGSGSPSGKVIISNLTYPTIDGVSGHVLTTDGAGILSFQPITGTNQNLWATIVGNTGSTTANSTTDTLTINGTGAISTSISGDTLTISTTALTDIVNDTTPQLGGALDVNGQQITSVSSGNVVINPNGTGQIEFGGIFYTKRLTQVISNNVSTSTFITYDAATFDVAFIDYGLRRVGDGHRAGTLMIVNDGTNVSMTDTGSELGTSGVTFTAVITGSNVEVRYSSTNTGNAGTLAYTMRRWNI